jgi:TnpA family transposase
VRVLWQDVRPPAITLWNTAYLDRALSALEEARIPVPSEYLDR